MKNWVTIGSENAFDALIWAKENCPSYITNRYHQTSDDEFTFIAYDFFFTDNQQGQRDMTAFTLRWVR